MQSKKHEEAQNPYPSESDLCEPLRKSVYKRLPWLAVLLSLGMLVSGIVGMFEQVVEHLSVLIGFQSLILGMAGNVGTQSLAVTIRVLTDEGIGKKEKRRFVQKEARVGLVNGICLGILSFLCIGLYLSALRGFSLRFAFSVSLCTGLAMAISILLAGVTGTVIPLLFQRLNVDPAVASGPLITTVNDLVAVLSYYGLAWLFLIRILGL